MATVAQKALLTNKVAIITGAASTIGREIATKFVMHGARVILTDFDNQYDICVDTAKELKNTETFELGTLGLAEAMECDVRDPENIDRVIQQVSKRYSHLDIFYNNAGSNGHVSSTDIDNFKKTMAVNVESVLASIKHAGAAMARNDPKGGCILCTGSTTGVLGDLVPSAYSVSKAALIGMVRAAAAELEDNGVRVNAISPHLFAPTFDSNMLQKKIFRDTIDTPLDKMIDKYLIKRVVTAEDVANAAVYLASDASKGVTGHNLVLNGKFPPIP